MDRKFVRMIKISNINLNSENQYLDISKKGEKEKRKKEFSSPKIACRLTQIPKYNGSRRCSLRENRYRDGERKRIRSPPLSKKFSRAPSIIREIFE